MFDLADTELNNSIEDQIISYVSAVSRVVYARRLEVWKKDNLAQRNLAEHKRANEVAASLWTTVNDAIPIKFPNLPRDERSLFKVRDIHKRALWAVEVGIS
ncbi:MAG: hypothetical protein ACRYG8_44995 [Janthinobacterium lividum]